MATKVMSKRLAAMLLAGWLLTVPGRAESAPDSAEALFFRARKLMKAGDCSNALPLLTQSHSIDPTVGTHFNLAICQARLGRLTRARKHLQAVLDGLAPDDERRAHAERALRDLVPRIPSVILEIDDTSRVLERVSVDGEALPGIRPKEPFAVDPGLHEIEVVLAGEARQVRRFKIAERQVYTWSLGSRARSERSASPTATFSRPLELTAPSSAETGEWVWTKQRKIAAVAAGTSVAALGVATGFSLSARSIYDSSDPFCGSNDVCEREGIERRDRARQHGNIATVAVTVGVASALAAGALWLTGAPNVGHDAKRLSVRLQLNREERPSGSILFSGRFN